MMLHAGLDLSRRRMDYCLLNERGERVEVGATPPDADGLVGLAQRVSRSCGRAPVRAAIESMNGARFVHDAVEREGWEVEVADAQKVRGLAPLACKTDRIDAWVLAELSRRDLVPAIWLPDFAQRAERERARFRLFLVRQRSSLTHRIHAQLLAFGHACPVSDLFGRQGRELLEHLDFPEPWRGGVLAMLEMIDDLDEQIAGIDAELRRLGADHRDMPLLMSAPGIAWALGDTIAAEIGDIARFASPTKLAGDSGLCPRVYQSGATDRRGHLTHAGPRYLRWALMEAATHACRHPAHRGRYLRTKRRLGRQRGPKVAQVDVARRLAEAIWHMLTRNQPFAPAGAAPALAAETALTEMRHRSGLPFHLVLPREGERELSVARACEPQEVDARSVSAL
jgi:transposase